MIVHINGWPGVGKRTVGEVLCKKLNARFIHNHLLHDVAIVCAGLSSADRWDLYDTVQRAAYATLARRPRAEVFVMTNALCTASSREQVAWRQVVELAMARNVPLVPIVLETTAEENIRRLQSPERLGNKMTDPSLLREFMTADTIQRPDVPELLVLDASALAPEQAAERICSHLDTIRAGLRPATLQHLRML